MPPALESELLVDRVLQDLNRTDAFDADIEFLPKDNLIIHWNENDVLIFQYYNQKWSTSNFWGMEDPESGLLLKKGIMEARSH